MGTKGGQELLKPLWGPGQDRGTEVPMGRTPPGRSPEGTGGLAVLLPGRLLFCRPPSAHELHPSGACVVTHHLCSTGTAVGHSASNRPSKQPTQGLPTSQPSQQEVRRYPRAQTAFLGSVKL